MKNFGKLTVSNEIIELPGANIGVDEEGNPIIGPARKQPILVFRDANGVEWFDLVKLHPHPFYIAVDDNNLVFSMTDDFQQSQIDGYTIVGIDQNYGFTFDKGGTVYQKVWTGTAIVDPIDLMTPEEKREAMPNITKRQLRLTLVRHGISLDQVQNAISSMPEGLEKQEAQIEWDDASEFRRLHPTLLLVGQALNLTPEQIDAMWAQAISA